MRIAAQAARHMLAEIACCRRFIGGRSTMPITLPLTQEASTGAPRDNVPRERQYEDWVTPGLRTL